MKPTYEDQKNKELKVNNLNRGRINVNFPSEIYIYIDRERTLRCSKVFLAFVFI